MGKITEGKGRHFHVENQNKASKKKGVSVLKTKSCEFCRFGKTATNIVKVTNYESFQKCDKRIILF